MAHQLICMLVSLCTEALQTLGLTYQMSRLQGKPDLRLVHAKLRLCMHHHKQIIRPVSSTLIRQRATSSCGGALHKIVQGSCPTGRSHPDAR